MVRGFDEFFGFLHGAKLYFPTVDEPGIHQIAEAPVKGKEKTEQNPLNPMMRGREPTTEPGYLTDAFAREAVSFIERHRAQPFFLYVPFNAPHTPLMVDDERYDRFAGVGDETHRVHAAMMGALDDGVGRIVAALRGADLLENTLVVLRQRQRLPDQHRGLLQRRSPRRQARPVRRRHQRSRSSPPGRGRSLPAVSSTSR